MRIWIFVTVLGAASATSLRAMSYNLYGWNAMGTGFGVQRPGKSCENCGPGVSEEELEICLIGSDVVALFPSIKSKNTGKIVRKRVERSPLKFKGFNFKHGARYIAMNKKYTSDLHELWGVLPYRRKVNGVTPGMMGKYSNKKEETEEEMEKQWVFPKREPKEWKLRLIIGRCAEIDMRVVFEHFSYKFGGQ